MRILRFFSAILLLLSFTPAWAQGTQSAPVNVFTPQTLSELRLLQQAALASDYAYQQLAHLTDNIGPRLSGSPQAQQAVDYVAGEMRRVGLEVSLEKVMVPHWVRGLETGELTEFPGQAPGTTQKIVLTALGGSVATPADGLTAQLVVVNTFDELNAMSRDQIAGKIVLFNEIFDKKMAAEGLGDEAYEQAILYRANAPVAAQRLGAVAALVRSLGGADYRIPHTGATDYDPAVPKIPAAAVTAEDAGLLARLTRQGPVRMHLVLTPQTLPDAESYNVVADLKGSEHPEQVIIISGHLDSWDLGTGAIDDGAGVAVAMQAAQLLKQLGLHPKRTIRVIAWMNEENGTRGGNTYARDHAGDIANHFAAIESDFGAGHPVGLLIAGKPEIAGLLRPVSHILESSGAGLSRMSNSAGTDVGPLVRLGVPGFSPIQDGRFYFNYHHTPADTLDKVDERELNENAAILAVLAYALAQMPQALPR